MDKEKFLEKYKDQTEDILKNNSVGEVIFSNGTYEIQIKNDEDIWPFLQLDDNGNIKDSFCTCLVSEEEKVCPHLLSAYLFVCKDNVPLHVQFKNSLWYTLCFLAFQKNGPNTKALKQEKDKGVYYSEDSSNRLFFIKAKGQPFLDKLDDIINNRVEETEETSIKFSSLSMEELENWKKGKPSENLKFELSFWSDIAKWLFLLSKTEDYQISYSMKDNELPFRIKIAFADLNVSFFIDKTSWPIIIPALVGINSSLKVHDVTEEEIEGIVYHPYKMCFTIERKKDFPKQQQQKTKIVIGSWQYIPNDGFYPHKIDDLESVSIIKKEKISSFLDNYSSIFAKLCKNVSIHVDPYPCKYYFYFSKENDFYIRLYLFEKDDLIKKTSQNFGRGWFYIEDKGFYLLKNPYIEGIEEVIPYEKVSEYINKNRQWLCNFEEVEPHFTNLRSNVSYVFEDDELKFVSEFELPEDYIDFGQWVFVKGRGFINKNLKSDFPIKIGTVVKKKSISSFIDNHKEDLKQIENFFIEDDPIEKIGMDISLSEKELITILPQIVYKENVFPDDIVFFTDYLYWKGKGFFPLLEKYKLPQKYKEETTISLDKESYFLKMELPSLKEKALYINPRLKSYKYLKVKIKHFIREDRKGVFSWLIDLEYISDFGRVSVIDLWDEIQQGKKYSFSRAGLIDLKDPRFNWLKDIDKKRFLPKRRLLRLTTFEWIKLSSLEVIEKPREQTQEAKQIRHYLTSLDDFEVDKPVDINLLNAHLRPYQEKGSQWLWFLYCYGLSGLLCDEMGLGKTHQAMALMASISALDKDKKFKYLVVCPTSVIYHWEELLKKFLPSLKPYIYHGQARTLDNFKKDYDILLTSYGILRIGKDNLKKINFQLSVYDEVQVAKNHTSQTHKALRKVKSLMKLGLTGTPIENYLREIKSLFDLILPSYMPGDIAFKQMFLQPIEKENDESRKKLLAKLIKPFVLRRKKKEVLLDLPEKIEEISYCDLSEEQSKIYSNIALLSKKALLRQLEDNETSIPYAHIFSLLTKLKQICDHPSVILKDVDSYSKHDSGKWNLFIELLSEARESNQKIVVFSQYLDMLTIIEKYLQKQKIGYASIRGSTRDRKQQIDKFKNDPKCEVFVASLLAAGVGIELSSASVVIHYDRWWNPAKEDQATDRVHRIGQTRGVQVFKLVTKHTIEERINEIIESKKGLIEEVIGRDDSEQIKSFTRQELIAILQELPE